MSMVKFSIKSVLDNYKQKKKQTKTELRQVQFACY